MTTNTSSAVMADYTDAIAALPDEAFLGSLLYFSISAADVHLGNARRDLTAAGLATDGLRKNLRPIDAYKKASKRIDKKLKEVDGVRSEFMVRSVGEDANQAYAHIVLERAQFGAGGKKRRLLYHKVGEIRFTRGKKQADGSYVDHGVEVLRTTSNMPPGQELRADEDQWLTEQLLTFEDHYDHLLNYLDSHAVRTFVREYIYSLSGICVKESGGLYFVKQDHADEIERLATWVRSIGSEFNDLPLLNLGKQKAMIMEAFEDETVKETERLMAEVGKILAEPGRKIEEKTWEGYADTAARLSAKVDEYAAMLGDRADRAVITLELAGQQLESLGTRVKDSKTTQVKLVTT